MRPQLRVTLADFEGLPTHYREWWLEGKELVDEYPFGNACFAMMQEISSVELPSTLRTALTWRVHNGYAPRIIAIQMGHWNTRREQHPHLGQMQYLRNRILRVIQDTTYSPLESIQYDIFVGMWCGNSPEALEHYELTHPSSQIAKSVLLRGIRARVARYAAFRKKQEGARHHAELAATFRAVMIGRTEDDLVIAL